MLAQVFGADRNATALVSRIESESEIRGCFPSHPSLSLRERRSFLAPTGSGMFRVRLFDNALPPTFNGHHESDEHARVRRP
jgi:hypothetical protein